MPIRPTRAIWACFLLPLLAMACASGAMECANDNDCDEGLKCANSFCYDPLLCLDDPLNVPDLFCDSPDADLNFCLFTIYHFQKGEDHFYTRKCSDGLGMGYRFVGPLFRLYRNRIFTEGSLRVPITNPFFQYWHPRLEVHYYTQDEGGPFGSGYTDQVVLGYIVPEDAPMGDVPGEFVVPLFSYTDGKHRFYSLVENDPLAGDDYLNEGKAGWVWPIP